MKCIKLGLLALAMVLGIAVADLFDDNNNFNDDDFGRYGHFGGGSGGIGGYSSYGSGYGSYGSGYGSYGSGYDSYGKGFGSYGKGIGSFGYSSFAPVFGLPAAGGAQTGGIGSGALRKYSGLRFKEVFFIHQLYLNNAKIRSS